ncbi:MAG TPA: alpha-amylase family glycosyl hydrolase, partial [Pseudonocardiaceae bacterium]|nr:alpha-amylase family glycosyl hydrolase [Pseudonocardiaceae bacterium]
MNTDHPAVRREIEKAMGYWLRLGVSGFRVDAVPFLIESRQPDEAETHFDFDLLRRMRETLAWRH